MMCVRVCVCMRACIICSCEERTASLCVCVCACMRALPARVRENCQPVCVFVCVCMYAVLYLLV